MSGFNFGQIGNIMSELFDTDYVDIKRDESGQLKEVYSNIKCHIAFSSVDNPNPETVDIKPIIQSLTVHFPLWVDVRNDDFIIAKRMSDSGDILAVYSGRCGNPIVSQGRQKVSVIMSATQNEEPTPVPPKDPINISLEFVSNGAEIQETSVYQIEKGDNFQLTAPLIEGYIAVDCEIDGEPQGSTIAIIAEIDSEHTVRFIYEASGTSDGFRFLVKGLYTKNDGSLANGWHLYKKIPLDSVSENNGVYTVSCNDVDIEHEDNGKTLKIAEGVKLVLVPSNIFIRVIGLDKANGKVTFGAVAFNPTQDEAEAYVCDWY